MSGGLRIYCVRRNKYKSNFGCRVYREKLVYVAIFSRGFWRENVVEEKWIFGGWGGGFLEKLKEVNPCKPHTGHLDPRQISGTTSPPNTLLAVLFCSRAVMFSSSKEAARNSGMS